MSNNTLSLGDRMKAYENAIDFKLNPCMQYVIRLDGKGFSKMVKKWKCKKPFDERFNKAINYASKKLFNIIPNVEAIWHGSDEISIWFKCPNVEDMYFLDFPLQNNLHKYDKYQILLIVFLIL